MKFLQFKEQLQNFIIFNLNDIRKIEGNFDLRRLNEWKSKGYIKMIRRGNYIFDDLKVNESVLFLIAQKIYAPSYVSLEMAFAYYNLIPEGVYAVTSVTSQKTNIFKSPVGEFIYSHVKPEFLFGYKLLEYQGHNYKIAEVEKALLDYFYLNRRFATDDDFSEMRFNAEEFIKIASKRKVMSYLKVFHNKKLEQRVKRFLEFIHYA